MTTTRKAKPISPAPPLPDEIVWLAACLVGELGLLVAHDGRQLPAPGAAHFAGEVADDVLTEFQRRYRRG